MTRFARHGEGRKRPHQASDWTELKGGNKDKASSKSHDKNKQETGRRKDRSFKPRNNFSKDDKFGKKGKMLLKCFKCEKFGHRAFECRDQRNDADIVCFVCKKNGHIAMRCPDKPEGLKEEWRKVKRSEFRRQKRQDKVLSAKHCFNCREPGHQFSDCPKNKKDVEHGTGICFKCGSTEHSVHKCKAKVPHGEYPYAKCFICGETGHLSKQCPDNPRGLYPNGGCCNECGSVEHLKRDCPEYQKKFGVGDIKLQTLNTITSLDSNEIEVEPMEFKEVEPVRKKKNKIVTF